MKHVMIFLAERKYQELHVFAVMLLASCVEDADVIKVGCCCGCVFLLNS